MTTSMFGTPLGFRTYDEDQAKMVGMASMADYRAGQTRHQDALIELNKAQAETMRRKQAADERRLKSIQDGVAAANKGSTAPGGSDGSSAPGDPYSGLERQMQTLGTIASVLASAGAVDESAKLLKEVAGGLNSISNARMHGATQKKTELETQIKQIHAVREALSEVQSPRDFDSAMMVLKSRPELAELFDPKSANKLPDVLKQYNPNTLKFFMAGSDVEIKKRELKLKEIDEGRKQADTASLISLRKIQGNVAERRADLYERRTEAVEKAGGKVMDIGTVNEGEIKAVRAELKRQGIDLDTEDKGAAAQSLAEQARALWKGTGRSPDEARAYVISEAIRRGEIAPGSVKLPGLGDTKVPGMSPTYKPKPGSVSKPLPLPASAEALVPGEFYVGKSGAVKQYTKNGWREVTRMKRQVVGGALADDGNDEE